MDSVECKKYEAALYACNICKKGFLRASGLSNHVLWIHEKKRIKKEHVCFQCDGKRFSTLSNLNRHIKALHTVKNSAPRKGSSKKLKFPKKNDVPIYCPLCHFESYRSDMTEHFVEEHSINLESEDLSFDTNDSFFNWKEKIELETCAHFVLARGVKKKSDGTTYRVYICHRSGMYKSRGRGLRHTKLVGSNKINAFCPSKIRVTSLQTGLVKVNFIKTHVGHSMDIGRLPLTKTERDYIAKKLSLKTPFEDIINDVRDSLMNSELHRVHLLTKKDLHNIVQCYNLKRDIAHNRNDFPCIDSWITNLNKTSTVVRLYKPEGVLLDSYPQLKKEDFVLILANDVQLKLLQLFGSDCICIDRTQNLNTCGLELCTLLVVDDLKQGIPGAFLFSNRYDFICLKLFFEVIKKSLLNHLKPQYFMSDVSEIVYNAWCDVMPAENTFHLYSTWHVDRIWKSYISKIKSKEKQNDIYKRMKSLMSEKSVEFFNLKFKRLVCELFEDIDLEDFATCFEPFKSNISSWAYCHCFNSRSNTNIHVENMQRTLKHIFLKGKKKRLDKSVYVIMKMVRDKLFDTLISLNGGVLCDELVNLWKCHNTSLDTSTITIKKENVWKISSSTGTEEYQVIEANRSCNCIARCDVCLTCVHAFTCTCYEAVIKWKMCKHIHLVSQLEKDCNQGVYELVGEETLPIEEVVSNIKTDSDCYELIEEKIVPNIENFSSLMTESVDNDIILHIGTQTPCSESFEEQKQNFVDQLNLLFSHITNEKQLHAARKQIALLDATLQTSEMDKCLDSIDSTQASNDMSFDDTVEIEITIQEWEP